MSKVDPIPDDTELQKRRAPKYIIDPKDVAPKDDLRVRQWGLGIMKKHESKLNSHCRNREIVCRKEIEPEEIDIKNFYRPLNGLHWMIFRDEKFWVLRLCGRRPESTNDVILAQLTYANIDHI